MHICILNIFHYQGLTLHHLTFEDESLRVLGRHILNHFSENLKAESSLETSKKH